MTDFVTAIGLDGVPYSMRILEWNLERLGQAWEQWKRYPILGDDIPRTLDGFIVFATLNNSIWFETVNLLTDEQVGVAYINQMVPSLTARRYVSANFHAVQWDAKAGPRQPLARAFIAQVFRMLNLHRMVAEIPLRFGGAIRAAKKIGFVPEGRLRAARLYDGEWYDVAILSILEDEVAQWAAHSHHSQVQETGPEQRITLVS